MSQDLGTPLTLAKASFHAASVTSFSALSILSWLPCITYLLQFQLSTHHPLKTYASPMNLSSSSKRKPLTAYVNSVTAELVCEYLSGMGQAKMAHRGPTWKKSFISPGVTKAQTARVNCNISHFLPPVTTPSHINSSNHSSFSHPILPFHSDTCGHFSPHPRLL